MHANCPQKFLKIHLQSISSLLNSISRAFCTAAASFCTAAAAIEQQQQALHNQQQALHSGSSDSSSLCTAAAAFTQHQQALRSSSRLSTAVAAISRALKKPQYTKQNQNTRLDHCKPSNPSWQRSQKATYSTRTKIKMQDWIIATIESLFAELSRSRSTHKNKIKMQY
jgi:hypothetical protein